MSKRAFIVLTGLAIGTAAAGSAAPADDARRDIPITDPIVLERLGLQPDDTHVYATPEALRQLMMSPAEQAAAQEEIRRAEIASAQSGGPFGTAFGYSPLLGEEILPAGSGEYGYLGGPLGGRYCVSGTSVYTAQLAGIPHGAHLNFLRVWVYDDVDQDLHFNVYRRCQPDFQEGPRVTTLLASVSTSGTGGLKSVAAGIGEDIDLQSCEYKLEAFFLEECPGADLRIQKVRMEWHRQVSPAPAAATFADVPAGHLFFQHVEALAASGITGGCGGGAYCPNAPVTRGQMAVFLAKALGLHWGDF
ncbi:MAG: S-layer homology domain-containing protein [Thermoanaerobaculia bacterium]